MKRGAAHSDRAGAKGTGTDRNGSRIALHDSDFMKIDTQPVGEYLCKGRRVALAVVVRAEICGDATVRRHAYGGRFVESAAGPHHSREARRRNARGLEITGQPDASQPSPFFRIDSSAREAGVIRDLERALEDARKVAAVVRRPDRRLVGHGPLRNQIPAPDLGAVHAELARGLVDKALKHIARLRAAGASIGVGGYAVREHTDDLDMDRRRAVNAGQERAVDWSRDGRAEGRNVSAEIGASLHAKREEASVAVQGKRGARAVVPALGIGQERFVARRDPLYRAAQPPRRPDDDRLLRIVLALVAEAAAHVLRHNAQLALAQPELRAHVLADVMRGLRGAVQRIAGCDGPARLDCRPAQAVVDELDIDPVRGASRTPHPPASRHHASSGSRFPTRWFSGLHNQSGPARRRLPPVTCFPQRRQRPARRRGAPCGARAPSASAPPWRGAASCAHRADAVALHVPAGKNQHRVGTFDFQDAGMSVRRSNEDAMQHPGECQHRR